MSSQTDVGAATDGNGIVAFIPLARRFRRLLSGISASVMIAVVPWFPATSYADEPPEAEANEKWRAIQFALGAGMSVERDEGLATGSVELRYRWPRGHGIGARLEGGSTFSWGAGPGVMGYLVNAGYTGQLDIYTHDSNAIGFSLDVFAGPGVGFVTRSWNTGGCLFGDCEPEPAPRGFHEYEQVVVVATVSLALNLHLGPLLLGPAAGAHLGGGKEDTLHRFFAGLRLGIDV